MEIYDKIGESYAKQSSCDIKRRVTADYTFFDFIGDVRGKSILDLACGDGYYCRPLKSAGAAEVAGVDISGEMIKLARQEEKKNPLGIRYECADVLKLPVIGKFDIVLGSFLLHYSKTKEELSAMCRNIYANVKAGGRFAGINDCPDNPLQLDKKFGITRTCEGPVKEGSVIKITLYKDNESVCSFNNYHWDRKTYADSLTAAGFRNIVWRGFKVSQEGIDKFGSGFWEPYLKQPGVAIFGCERQPSGKPYKSAAF